jgi:hypothetical protein
MESEFFKSSASEFDNINIAIFENNLPEENNKLSKREEFFGDFDAIFDTKFQAFSREKIFFINLRRNEQKTNENKRHNRQNGALEIHFDRAKLVESLFGVQKRFEQIDRRRIQPRKRHQQTIACLKKKHQNNYGRKKKRFNRTRKQIHKKRRSTKQNRRTFAKQRRQKRK